MPVQIDWLGQSGFRFRYPAGPTVCIDPYLSHAMMGGRTRARLLPIPIAPWDLGADLVITTHDHGDHFDEVTLRPIAESPRPIFAGPTSCREHWRAMGLPVDRFLRLDQGESLDVAGVRLTATYARHRSGASEDAIGVILEGAGLRIYHVGDSEYTPELVTSVADIRPDVLLVPINGRGGNMDAAQAAQLTNEVRPRLAIPMHYGVIPTNTADPQDFVDACRASAGAARVMLLHVGVRFTLESSATD